MLRAPVTQPRRLLLTLDAVGGVWRYTLDLVAALDQHGIACLLVGFGPPPTPEQRAACTRLVNAELVWADAALDWMTQDESPLHVIAGMLAGLARDWTADLLHLNVPSQAVGLRADLAVVVAAHSCVPTWWDAVRGSELPRDWQWQWRRNRDGLDRADTVLAPSGSHAGNLRRVYGPLRNMQVVYNGAGVSPAATTGREAFVLSVGRWWDESKNGRVLDEAAAGTRWPVVMAGPLTGPLGQSVYLPNVQTPGSLTADEVLALMRRATIFAAPSRYEPFGLAALEAALCGAALVLADIPTFRELWSGVAEFVPPGVPTAWARALDALAADPVRCHHMAALARSRAGDFTAQRQADAIVAVYAATTARSAVAMTTAA